MSKIRNESYAWMILSPGKREKEREKVWRWLVDGLEGGGGGGGD